MPVSLDSSRSTFTVGLLAALLSASLLLAGLLPAGCSSVKAPKPAAQSEAQPPESAASPEAHSEAEPSGRKTREDLWDLDAQAGRDVPVESWAELEVDEFNATVDAAVDSGKAWASDPIDVVEHFIRAAIGGANYTRLEKKDNRVEWPDSTVITLIRDRYADDSIRGDWHRITLYRLPDGSWRLSEALRAFRCYRGHQQDAYGKRLCL
jgi:hypothetical protein